MHGVTQLVVHLEIRMVHTVNINLYNINTSMSVTLMYVLTYFTVLLVSNLVDHYTATITI